MRSRPQDPKKWRRPNPKPEVREKKANWRTLCSDGRKKEIPISLEEIPKSSREIGISGREIGISSRETPKSGKEIPISLAEIPKSKRELVR